MSIGLGTLLSRFANVTSAGPRQWAAECPVHEDRRASLSVAEGEDGRALITCHAGCKTEDVVAAVGLEMRDLFPPDETKGKRRGRNRNGKIVATYEYQNADGSHCFEVVRYVPKDFRQRRRKADGDYAWSIKGIKTVPFRLPELLAHPTELLCICEGEEDVLSLSRIGVLATTAHGGSGKWRAEYKDFVGARPIAALADNDSSGQLHVADVAEKLYGTATSIRIVELPGLPPKGDVSDWIKAGGTKEELLDIISNTPEWTPPAPSAVVQPKAEISDLDPGTEAHAFLESLVDENGVRRLRHWRGSYWLHGRGAYRECTDDEVRSRLVKRLDRDYCKLTNSAVANVLGIVRAYAMLSSRTGAAQWIDRPPLPECEQWDPQDILPTVDRLINLRAFADGCEPYSAPSSPAFFSASSTNFAFDASPPPPDNWLTFLAQIWSDDFQSINALQEWFGLLLTPDTTHQKILLIVGPKRSGKGTLARILTQLVGPENVAGPTLSSLATNFGLSPLLGKSVAIVSDARLSGRVDTQVIVERLLSISGEDALTIDRKFREPVTCKLPTRFVILSNELPRLLDSSNALSSRFVVLRLTQSFYGREDRGLTAKILPELAGILGWSIAGWRRLRSRGHLLQPDSGIELAADLHSIASPVGQFVSDCCLVGMQYRSRIADIFSEWRRWCDQVGKREFGTEAMFGRELRAVVPDLKVVKGREGSERFRSYDGIGVKAGW